MEKWEKDMVVENHRKHVENNFRFVWIVSEEMMFHRNLFWFNWSFSFNELFHNPNENRQSTFIIFLRTLFIWYFFGDDNDINFLFLSLWLKRVGIGEDSEGHLYFLKYIFIFGFLFCSHVTFQLPLYVNFFGFMFLKCLIYLCHISKKCF